MSQEQLEQIELDMEDAQEAVDLLDALTRLTKNKDFNLLIDENYFITAASNCVLMKSKPSAQAPDFQAALDKEIIGIGIFRQYLSKVYNQGQVALKSIQDCSEAREEILAEDRT